MDYTTIEVELRKSESPKVGKAKEVSVKITFVENDTDCRLGFKIMESSQLYTFGKNVIVTFPMALEYLNEIPCVLQLTLVHVEKSKRPDLDSELEIILNDYYGCSSEAFEAILISSGRELRLLLEIQIAGVVEKSQPTGTCFDLINGRDEEQLMLNTKLSSTFGEVQGCEFEKTSIDVDPLKETLESLEVLFPGMHDDYENDAEELETIGMYCDMLEEAVESLENEVVFTPALQKKSLEVFDSLFLPEQNAILEKDVLIVPIMESKYADRLYASLEQELSQNYLILPVYLEQYDKYSVITQWMVLISIIYDICRAFMNPGTTAFEAQETLNEWVEQHIGEDLRIDAFNELEFCNLKSELADVVQLKEYVISNAFVLQSHIKILLFNQDRDGHNAQIYEAIWRYNSLVKCNSMREISISASEDTIGKTLGEAINIVQSVSKILRIPATEIIPAVIYTIPVPSESLMNMIQNYGENTDDVEHFSELLYTKPCGLGSLAEELGETSRHYSTIFLSTRWIFSVYCILQADIGSELYKNAEEIYTTSILLFLANERFCAFRPLSLSISGREMYYKDKEASPKLGTPSSSVAKLIKTKHSVNLWESLSFNGYEDVKTKIKCLSSDNVQLEFEHDQLESERITNELGLCSVFDYAKGEFFERLSHQLRVSNGSASFQFPEDEELENDVLVSTSDSLRFLTYFRDIVQYQKRISYQFQLKKDEYIAIFVDESRRYNAEELVVEEQDHICILTAYM